MNDTIRHAMTDDSSCAELGDYVEVFAVGEAVLGIVLVGEYGDVVPVGFGRGSYVQDKTFGATNTEIWMNYQDSHLYNIS